MEGHTANCRSDCAYVVVFLSICFLLAILFVAIVTCVMTLLVYAFMWTSAVVQDASVYAFMWTSAVVRDASAFVIQSLTMVFVNAKLPLIIIIFIIIIIVIALGTMLYYRWIMRRIQIQIEKLEKNIQTAKDDMLKFMQVRSRTLSELSTLRKKVYDKHQNLQDTKIATGTVKVVGAFAALALAPFTGGISLGFGTAIGFGGWAYGAMEQSRYDGYTEATFQQIEDLIKQEKDAICHVAKVCTDIASDSTKLELMIFGVAKAGALVDFATTGVTKSITMMSSVLKFSKQTAIATKGVSAVVVQTYTLSNTKILVSSMRRSVGFWSTAVSIPMDIYALIQDIKKYNESKEVSAIDKLICDLTEHRDKEKRKFEESIENYKKLLIDWKSILEN